MIKDLKMENIENIDVYTFESLIGGGNKVFEIPLFQRNYNWGEESCTQLFNDILNSPILFFNYNYIIIIVFIQEKKAISSLSYVFLYILLQLFQ